MLTAWIIVDVGLLVAVTIFAIQAIRARRLIVSALWLASGSVVIAIIFYALGAGPTAIFGLSVGSAWSLLCSFLRSALPVKMPCTPLLGCPNHSPGY
jgi:hypothetical protein